MPGMAVDTIASRHVLAVMGPTASGKTRLAVALARAIQGDLVNADSRQSIAELAIGVCKPTSAELQGIICHGLGWSELSVPFSAAAFRERAIEVMAEIWDCGRIPVVVGGTGLYIRALLGGFDFGGVGPDPERQRSLASGEEEAAMAVSATRSLARVGRSERRNWPELARSPGVCLQAGSRRSSPAALAPLSSGPGSQFDPSS
jgi:tRNA A37 N6-isopentenylltransferase MiaA